MYGAFMVCTAARMVPAYSALQLEWCLPGMQCSTKCPPRDVRVLYHVVVLLEVQCVPFVEVSPFMNAT